MCEDVKVCESRLLVSLATDGLILPNKVSTLSSAVASCTSLSFDFSFEKPRATLMFYPPVLPRQKHSFCTIWGMLSD